jgi:glutamine---fructose-6-phosphate transaminase (isomerizing)
MKQPYTCYYEITNQKAAWQEAIDVILSNFPRIDAFFNTNPPNRILFTGCTSPYYAGESASAAWQARLGIPTQAAPCSELVLFPDAYYCKGDNPILIVLSRSGKTTEALWAIEEFEKRYPGRSLLIGCSENTPLDKLVSMSLHLPQGFDVTLPQTKSFSAMYLATQFMGALLGKQEENIRILKSAPKVFDGIVERTEEKIVRIMEDGDFDKIIYLGSGPLYGIAREATLKIMEMSFSNAFCFPFLESRHGPRSLFDEKTLVVGLISHSGLRQEARVLEEYTRDLGVTTLAIVPDQNWVGDKTTHVISTLQDWPDEILGLAYLPVTQLIGYYRALKLGANPDVSKNTTAFIEIIE